MYEPKGHLGSVYLGGSRRVCRIESRRLKAERIVSSSVYIHDEGCDAEVFEEYYKFVDIGLPSTILQHA